MNRMRKNLLFLVLALSSYLLVGCPPPLVPAPVRNVPADLSGVYMGTHEIYFEVTSPVPQTMHPESRPGPIHVNDGAGAAAQISLRLYENGEPCHLQGNQIAGTGRVSINPGQRCTLRMLYDNQPVIATMQVNTGNADFDGWTLRTDLTGPFVSVGLVNGVRTDLQGNARIVFSGNRQASR